MKKLILFFRKLFYCCSKGYCAVCKERKQLRLIDGRFICFPCHAKTLTRQERRRIERHVKKNEPER